MSLAHTSGSCATAAVAMLGVEMIYDVVACMYASRCMPTSVVRSRNVLEKGNTLMRSWDSIRPRVIVRSVLVVGLLAGGSFVTQADDDVARWEDNVQAFEKLHSSAPRDGILFVGSSSIRLWDTEFHFPRQAVINRGFGGSQMSDLLHYWDRIVLPLHPRIIVLYEGDNDIAGGEPATQVASEFAQLAARVADQLPGCRLIFLSIKPSLKRWKLYDEMKKANDAIERICDDHDFCHFVDVSTVMLGGDGKPLPELFVDDGLHLNQAGYVRWTKLVRPLLDANASSKRAK